MRNSIKAISEAIGRFICIGSASFGIASYANMSHHHSYWNGTIERVQTVDFNMLSHMLPAKLSQAMIEGDSEEIQRTLDSNYGLFGLVVTNCETAQLDCSQTVQYASSSNFPWRTQLTEEILATSTYDVLMDPPPLHPIGNYSDSRSPVRDSTGLRNYGAIIGRVYYVRGIPPTFLGSYAKWIRAWPESFLSDSGVNRYYSLTVILFAVGGFSAWVFMEIGFSKRRRQFLHSEEQRVQSEADRKKLKIEAQYLRQQMQGKLTEDQQIVESKRQHQLAIDAEQIRYQKQDQVIRSGLERLESKIATQAKEDEERRRRQSALEKTVREQERTRELLQEKIISLSSQKSESDQDREELQRKNHSLEKALQEEQDSINRSHSELTGLQQKLAQKSVDMNEETKIAEVLRKQLEESRHHQAVLSKQREASQQSIEEKAQEIEKNKQRIQELGEEIRNAKQSKSELESLMGYKSHGLLNHFEENVIRTLNNTQKAKSLSWRIIPQMDVSENNRKSPSMFTDCILIGNSFVVVIEAKNYLGKIRSEGDIKNTIWINSQNGDEVDIASCWGCNPYQQVHNYMNSTRSLLRRNMSYARRHDCNGISFYQVVVFPDGANLSALETELGEHSRVINLESLVDTIHDLERQTRSYSHKKGDRKFLASEIEDYLRGRPIKKAA